MAGGIAGLVSSILTSPMDMVKLQIQNGKNQGNNARKTFHLIWNKYGLKGLYRGIYATAAGYLPTWAIYFSVYEASKNYYAGLGDTPKHSLSAIQAGLTCTVFSNPLWVVRTRIMTQPFEYSNDLHHYKSVRDAFRKIWISEGWRAFFKGLGPSIMGISHVAIQFPLYEKLKHTGQGCRCLTQKS